MIIKEIRRFINLKVDDIYVDKKTPNCSEIEKFFKNIIPF